jgi:hypothetical protein
MYTDMHSHLHLYMFTHVLTHSYTHTHINSLAIAPGFSTAMHHLLVTTEELDDDSNSKILTVARNLSQSFKTARK